MSLTEKVVLGRSKAKSLDAVHQLNVWGCKLRDIALLSSLPNLEVLNISCNNIDDLSQLSSCSNLKELYVRRNLLENIEALKCLASLKNLKVLWLSGNPLCKEPGYREAVATVLPQVTVLDNKPLNQSVGKDDAVLQAVLLLLGQLDPERLRTVKDRVATLLA